jgi:hypothetical protein
MRYCEFDFWSPLLGAAASRISMVDADNREFFCIIERPDGREFTALRKKAVEALEMAIEAGAEPGEFGFR